MGIQKAIVSAIVSVIAVLTALGIAVPEFLDEQFFTTVASVIGTALTAFGVTWAVPNTPADE